MASRRASPRILKASTSTNSAVEAAARFHQMMGSRASSNSNRLRELAERAGIPGYLVDGAADMHRDWFDGKNVVGVTAGASAPEVLVQQVISQLRDWGAKVPQEIAGREEHVIFGLPRELRRPEVGPGSA